MSPYNNEWVSEKIFDKQAKSERKSVKDAINIDHTLQVIHPADQNIHSLPGYTNAKTGQTLPIFCINIRKINIFNILSPTKSQSAKRACKCGET